jgi:DNA-binding NarL/FixJ family response regulator
MTPSDARSVSMADCTVLLADSQTGFRVGLRSVLEGAGMRVVAEVDVLEQAVELASELLPTVCLLAPEPRASVVSAVHRIVTQAPGVQVVVVGASIRPDEVLAVVRAGANGFLARATSARGVLRTVEAVIGGQLAIPRSAVSAFVAEVRGDGVGQRMSVGGKAVTLTMREAQVLELLATGLSTRSLAKELGISEVTVRRHLATLAAKLGRRGRRELRRVRRVA